MSSAIKLSVLGFGLLALILVPFMLFGDQLESLLNGLLASTPMMVAGVVFAALAADVVLPLPSSLLSAAAAVWLGPVFGTCVIWAGMTTGHLLGYALGFRYGAAAVSRIAGESVRVRLEGMGTGMGMTAALVVTRAVPVLSEAATVVAGAAKMPLARFVLTCASANLGVAAVYGLLGTLVTGGSAFLLIFAASVAVPLLGYGVMRIVSGRIS